MAVGDFRHTLMSYHPDIHGRRWSDGCKWPLDTDATVPFVDSQKKFELDIEKAAILTVDRLLKELSELEQRYAPCKECGHIKNMSTAEYERLQYLRDTVGKYAKA